MEIALNTQSSLVIRELITRLRVSDVMKTSLFTGRASQSLRETQQLMRENRISGVPIIDDNGTLIGMITVDDIIKALDKGYIDELVSAHMSSNLVTLEPHLPLSVAINFFENYAFRRFPVVSSKGKLEGIISGRDILHSLLAEINREVDKLEELIPEEKIKSHEFFYRKFNVVAKDMELAGKASAEVKNFCSRSGFSRKLCRRIGVACFELEINIAVHSHGGHLTVVRENDTIQIIAQDTGPGIPDVEKAMMEGFSTASDWVRSYGFGAGMGLPNIKRVCDRFHISSDLEHGTMVTATFYLNGGEDEH